MCLLYMSIIIYYVKEKFVTILPCGCSFLAFFNTILAKSKRASKNYWNKISSYFRRIPL